MRPIIIAALITTSCAADTIDATPAVRQLQLDLERALDRISVLEGELGITPSQRPSGADAGPSGESDGSSGLDATTPGGSATNYVDYEALLPANLTYEAERWVCSTVIDGRCIAAVGDGASTYKYLNTKITEGELAKGVRVGEWRFWAEAGQVSMSLSGLPSELLRFLRVPTGTRLEGLIGYNDAAKYDGQVKVWLAYDPDTVIVETSYVDGLAQGDLRARSIDGRLLVEGRFEAGCATGHWMDATFQMSVLDEERPCTVPESTFHEVIGTEGTVASCRCEQWPDTTAVGSSMTACAEVVCPQPPEP